MVRPVCSAWVPLPTSRWCGGLRQTQIAEESVRHIGVVVLPGVHDVRCAPFLARQRVIQGRHFHEIRPRGGDQMDELGFKCYCL